MFDSEKLTIFFLVLPTLNLRPFGSLQPDAVPIQPPRHPVSGIKIIDLFSTAEFFVPNFGQKPCAAHNREEEGECTRA